MKRNIYPSSKVTKIWLTVISMTIFHMLVSIGFFMVQSVAMWRLSKYAQAYMLYIFFFFGMVTFPNALRESRDSRDIYPQKLRRTVFLVIQLVAVVLLTTGSTMATVSVMASEQLYQGVNFLIMFFPTLLTILAEYLLSRKPVSRFFFFFPRSLSPYIALGCVLDFLAVLTLMMPNMIVGSLDISWASLISLSTGVLSLVSGLLLQDMLARFPVRVVTLTFLILMATGILYFLVILMMAPLGLLPRYQVGGSDSFYALITDVVNGMFCFTFSQNIQPDDNCDSAWFYLLFSMFSNVVFVYTDYLMVIIGGYAVAKSISSASMVCWLYPSVLLINQTIEYPYLIIPAAGIYFLAVAAKIIGMIRLQTNPAYIRANMKMIAIRNSAPLGGDRDGPLEEFLQQQSFTQSVHSGGVSASDDPHEMSAMSDEHVHRRTPYQLSQEHIGDEDRDREEYVSSEFDSGQVAGWVSSTDASHSLKGPALSSLNQIDRVLDPPPSQFSRAIQWLDEKRHVLVRFGLNRAFITQLVWLAMLAFMVVTILGMMRLNIHVPFVDHGICGLWTDVESCEASGSNCMWCEASTTCMVVDCSSLESECEDEHEAALARCPYGKTYRRLGIGIGLGVLLCSVGYLPLFLAVVFPNASGEGMRAVRNAAWTTLISVNLAMVMIWFLQFFLATTVAVDTASTSLLGGGVMAYEYFHALEEYQEFFSAENKHPAPKWLRVAVLVVATVFGGVVFNGVATMMSVSIVLSSSAALCLDLLAQLLHRRGITIQFLLTIAVLILGLVDLAFFFSRMVELAETLDLWLSCSLILLFMVQSKNVLGRLNFEKD